MSPADRERGADAFALRADHLVTMSAPQAPAIEDGVVVVEGEAIVDVGPAAEVLGRHPGVGVTHLRGHALLPGLVNAHTHLAMTVFRGVADDRSLEDFLATVVPLEGELLDEDVVRSGSLAAMVESHLAGVTTALDMYFFADAVGEAASTAGFRAVTGPVVLDGEPPDAPGTTPEQRIELADAWLSEHPAPPGTRHAVSPHSTYLVSPANLASAAELAARHEAVFHIHLAESPAELDNVREALGAHPLEVLRDAGGLDERTVLAHAVHLDPEEVALLATSGASVAHCPASNLKLASGVAPVPEYLAAGVNVAIGTDGPASSNDLDVLGATRLAALLHKTVGRSGADPARLDARTALWMATRGGAVALGLGDHLGRLAPGSTADMVAIDLDTVHAQPVYDVHSAVVYAAGRGDVTHVWSSGRCVVADGEHRMVDIADVLGPVAATGLVVRGRR